MCSAPIAPTMFWSILGTIFPSLVVANEHYSKMYPFKYHMQRLIEEMGYMHLQATKPDTAGNF